MIVPRAMRSQMSLSVWYPANSDVTPECFAGACVVSNESLSSPMVALAKGLAPAKRYRGFSFGTVRDTAKQDVARSYEHAGKPKGAASPTKDRSYPLPGNRYTTWIEKSKAHSKTATTAASTSAIPNWRQSTCQSRLTVGRRLAQPKGRRCPARSVKVPTAPPQQQQWGWCARAGSGNCVH
jgi:hypothetical protein